MMVQSHQRGMRRARGDGLVRWGTRPLAPAPKARSHMGFIDRLKGLFGGKKEADTSLYEGLERQVEALENRLVITEHVKRVDGGIDQFEVAADEARRMLAHYGSEGAQQEQMEMLRHRIDLAILVAHLLRETDPEAKKKLCERFLKAFRDVRDRLHFGTKSKYERIRIDYESGRLR